MEWVLPLVFTLSKQFEYGLDEKLIVNVWSEIFSPLIESENSLLHTQ
jgi:hypothetical protein